LSDSFSNKPPTGDEGSASAGDQATGEHMARALREYQQARFGPIHADYLNIFRDRLQSALRSEERPPLLVANSEVDLFSAQIEKLKSKMFDETVRAMTHWFEVADKVGVRTEIDALLKESIEQFCESIGSDALKIAEGYVDLLRDAESAWRQKYPEKLASLAKPSA